MSDSADHPKSCPKCGVALPSEATDGLCPNCLMNEALQPTQVSDASKPRHASILAPEALAPFFPQYEILRMLGRGGMGAVYLARQISLNRLVAIKVLPSDMGESELGFAERFKNEAQAMAQLSHPSIVAVYDFGQTTNGLLYIVMEYIEGTDVQLMLTSQGRLHSAHAMAITAHVCDALAYAHSRGIIHRDIKPSNIMVSNEGVVKVADFGLAKMSQAQTTGLTQSGMAMGTPHFMAPEALTLGSAVDQRADIYAVGVMLYQMLTGKLPQGMFEMPSFQVPGLDPRYDRIVARALRDDREQRYQAAGELRHDLDAILTQPVEKVTPETDEDVAALPKVEARGRKKARVPSLPPPQTASPASVRKKPISLILTVLGLAAALTAAFIHFRDRGTGQTTTLPALATKNAPFVNSLGMKFVPVPGTKVLFSIWETRVKDYTEFARVKKMDNAWTKNQKNGVPVSREPEFPVCGLGWEDANTFCQWLTEKESAEGRLPQGMKYRLPTDEEWSRAVGLAREEGATPKERRGMNQVDFPWGIGFPPPKAKMGNYADAAFHEKFSNDPWMEGYSDDAAITTRVGSFAPNEFGIFDLGGNVWEFCEDLYETGGTDRVLRGASWTNNDHLSLLSSYRAYCTLGDRSNFSRGFRCVLSPVSSTSSAVSTISQSPSLPGSKSSPATATKAAPFINTLGMQFVPVPGTNILMCVHETRRGDYGTYAKEGSAVDQLWMNPTKDGIPVANKDDQPVSNVSWADAQAFCAWLSKKEGRRYRLPTDHEWSSAAGIGDLEKEGATPKDINAGIKDLYPWGSDWPPGHGAGNYADTLAAGKFHSLPTILGYADGHAGLAPVMSYPPNKLGIHDLGGNVWEWCEDWYDATQTDRFRRGGSYLDSTRDVLLSSKRMHTSPDERQSSEGFRCVVEPTAQSAGSSPSLPDSMTALTTASKDAPYVNSLGMKFVPVPIVGGPTKGERVLFSIWDTRVHDYLAFARANKVDGRWQAQQKDGVPAGRELDHPVVGVNWEDAQAFCQWLTAKEAAEGKLPPNMKYRLPSDEEWSWAVGLPFEPGATPAEKRDKNEVDFPWGIGYPPPGKLGNYADETFHAKFPNPKAGQDSKAKNWIVGYNDGYATTSPVGSFPANAHGLHDMGGNVWQWCEDWFDKDQQMRVLRGASWEGPDRGSLQSSRRRHSVPRERGYDHGFRCVLAPAVSPSPVLPVSASSTAAATKDAPFTNSLGMKFVPVPGTDALMCIHETRKKDYASYAGVSPGVDDSWTDQSAGGFTPTGNLEDHPVMKVSWEDARKFCAWLSQKEGKTYRLPTDQEWSIAVGIGQNEKWQQDTVPATVFKNQTDFAWGTQWPPPQGSGNFSDLTRKEKVPDSTTYYLHDYEDGFPTTAPVMSFKPNQIGLYDLSGNVCEWCEDWYDNAMKERVLRGGSWNDNDRTYLLSSYRGHSVPDSHLGPNGFRVVLVPTVLPAARASTRLEVFSSPASATQKSPFVNTLGMTFVPVPITSGPTDKKRVLFSVWETRVQDYSAFTKETRREWPRLDFVQGVTHPAVKITWEDAQAFCAWLTEKERKAGKLSAGARYRLPTDHEWSCAAGVGDEDAGMTPAALGKRQPPAFLWGDAWPPPAGAGNFAGEEWKPSLAAGTYKVDQVIEGYRDGFVETAPVGSFQANRLGLHDLAGNVWEWCEDWFDEQKQDRVQRGGSWLNPHPHSLSSTGRGHMKPDSANPNVGFRCVLEVLEAGEAAKQPAVSDMPPGSTDASASDHVPIPLGDIAPHPVDGFGVPLAGRRTFNGVPFEFANPPKYFITQNQYQPQSPVTASLKVDVPGASEVFLMMCGKGGGTPELEGKEIGNVTFTFSDGSSFVALLKMETHLRRASWLSDYTNPVKPPGDDVVQVSEAIVEPQFRGRPAKGYMDMLTIKLPQEKSGLTLTGITFNDTSAQTVRSIGPGFDVYAVTVRRAPSATTATKEAPFVNSLGMKFVPVPGTKVLFCMHTARIKDYAAFASETPALNHGWKALPDGVQTRQRDDYPVINVSWRDAQAFCSWLSKKEGKLYRLPTDREWSFAVGIGAQEEAAGSMPPVNLSGGLPDSYPWGSKWPPPKGAGNFADVLLKAQRTGAAIITGYDDGHAAQSPVMSYEPNQLGLYDMGGNLQQWCEDWYDSARTERVVRGSSWFDNQPLRMLSSYRDHLSPDRSRDVVGFRCVIETGTSAVTEPLKPIQDSAPSMPPKTGDATKEAPFTNTLGMKFVPVPGTQVLFCIHETRRQDYARFAEVIHDVNRSWMEQQENGVACGVERDHPVVGVSWDEAGRFCEWLSRKEGRRYRLPTDREWSWAAEIGQQEVSSPDSTPELLNGKLAAIFPWGGDYPPVAKDAGNYADNTWHEKFSAKLWIENFSDGYPTTAPVMSFKPNKLGLYDLGGNVWEFVQDWWNLQQQGRVLRGGSFNNVHQNLLLSSGRFRCHPTDRFNNHGFRVVLEP